MKFVALVSGGKDSILSTMMATAHGHELVCIAQLVPGVVATAENNKEAARGEEEEMEGKKKEDDLQEIDSPCFQTVGHHAVGCIARCLEVPLRQGAIYKDQCPVESLYYQKEEDNGISSTAITHNNTTNEKGLPSSSKKSAESTSKAATPNGGDVELVPIVEMDEVEVMFKLLEAVKMEFPDITAVSSGAILSDYQRTRVESCCSRLGLTSLAYLWQLDAIEVLDLVEEYNVDARLIKTSTMGLDPRKHLAKSLVQLRGYLNTKANVFHVAGEGGEFETLVLDAPNFIKKKLQFVPGTEVVNMIDDNPYAPTGHLLFQIQVVDKSEEEQTVGRQLLHKMAGKVAAKFTAKAAGFRRYLPTTGGAEGAGSELRRSKIPRGFIYSSTNTLPQEKKETGDADAENDGYGGGYSSSSEDEEEKESRGHTGMCLKKRNPTHFCPPNVSYHSRINLNVVDLRKRRQEATTTATSDDILTNQHHNQPVGTLAEQCTELLTHLQDTLPAPPVNPHTKPTATTTGGATSTSTSTTAPLDSIFFVMIHVPQVESFAAVNKEYVSFFAHMPPARAFVEWRGDEHKEVGEDYILGASSLLRFDVYSYQVDLGLYHNHQENVARGEDYDEDVDLDAMVPVKYQERKVLHVQGVSQWSAPCIGPYAQSNKVGVNVVIAGRVGLVAETSKLIVAKDPLAQFDVEFSTMMESTEGAMRCIGLPLGWLDITHVTFFVTTREGVSRVKKLWEEYFGALLPIDWVAGRAQCAAVADAVHLTRVQGRIVVVTALPAKAVVEVLTQSWPCGPNPFFQARGYPE